MSTSCVEKNKPVRCLLWGTGRTFREQYYTIKYYELTGEITVSGITSNNPLHSEIGGYTFIKKDQIDTASFDIIIIMATSKEKIKEITDEALMLGVDECDIIPSRVMNLIGFDINKYRKIKSNPPTIFCPNCWGGITYHQLGLRFESPIINMFFEHDDYIRFLQNPKNYIECELKYRETRWDGNINRYYPVAECDDIFLHFNHYDSFEAAKNTWDNRKKRIKWDNLFVMFYDEDPERVKRFLDTPYEKKICFVPYLTNQKNVVSVEYRVNDEMRKKPFWQIITGMASGVWQYYEVLDLLLECHVTTTVGFNK